MEIPHVTEAHADTGVINGKLGVWLFLASEGMLFGALFSSYVILRIGSPAWPEGGRRGWSRRLRGGGAG